ncbi:MAG: SemiSWEET family transporter [Candidatus Omnitrophica bacterium]|nr:SemiSWEET family transporter [Candidatus Omnitrophota bacterium]
MFSFVPQIIKVINTKSAKDVSLTTMVQLSLGVSLWIIYGFHLNNFIIITANSVTLTSLMILLCLYFNYGKIRK